MTTTDARASAITAIELAVAHLADALEELDRMPQGDRATVGLVAHALTNYLSVADATLDLLNGALHGHSNPEIATWLGALRHLGNLMQHTMGRLVEASTPAKFPLRPERIDIVKLMTRAAAHCNVAAKKRGLEVTCETVGEVPAIWADRVAVAVIADNLLSNALKHSRPGGAVLVQLVTGPGGVVCSIRDNGPGPDPVAQAQLIQNGLLIGTGAAPDRAPSGYGLSIARDLLARMDGQLRFEVTEGGGTCFSFRLPYAPQGAASPPEADRS